MARYDIDLTAAVPTHLDEFASHWSLPGPEREPDGRAAYEHAAADFPTAVSASSRPDDLSRHR